MCHSRIPLIEKLEGQRLKTLRARCRERRSHMAEGAVTYEEYQRMKAQGLIPDIPPTP